jgi:hypothetical protein
MNILSRSADVFSRESKDADASGFFSSGGFDDRQSIISRSSRAGPASVASSRKSISSGGL